MRETFSFANPVEVLRAVKVFAGDLYGSNLWQLGSDMAGQVYHAWNTTIKLAWQVPRGTHTYFVDRVLSCGISHVKTDIISKYVKFFLSLRESPSMEVSVLSLIVARDVRTTTGNNLQLLREMTGLDPWSCLGHQVKKVLGEKLAEMPQQDSWRLLYLQKLLEQRGEMYYRMEDTTQLTELIDAICLN